MKTSPTPVVSDSDVLIHLSNLRRIDLLQILFSSVSIPEFVKAEISEKEDQEINKALATLLIVHPTSTKKAKQIADRHGIHIGEAHVKALGESLKAKLFLSNERKVRKAALEEGFQVVGTIGIILRAAHIRAIAKSEALSLLEQMKSEDFRIHHDLIREAINTLHKKTF